MLGNRPAQESELVGPICARFGLTIEASRLLISEGRKVGFVVDCGELPQSVRCFVEEFPTPSTSMERNSSRGKALCFLPNGFKVVGLVEGSVYLGEVVYDENWKRSYKFHLVDGPEIVKSSSACSNPTSAFKEIEAVIKVTSTKKRHRKPDARSNGKLYMAVMYSATQRLLREKFRGSENRVPAEVRPLFIEWMENLSSNKAFSGNGNEGSSSIPSSLPSVVPKQHHTTFSNLTNKIHPVSAHTTHGAAPMALPLIKKDERNLSISSRFGFPFDLESDILNGDIHLSLDDANIDNFFPGETKTYEAAIPASGVTSTASNTNTIPLPSNANSRKTASGSVDDYLNHHSSVVDSLASRKRSSGSLDEQSPVLITRKRASGSIDEDSVVLKELDSTQPKKPQENGAPGGNSVVADAGELFADYFRIPDVQLQNGKHGNHLSILHNNINIPVAPSMHPMSLGPPLVSPRDGTINLPSFEDLIDPVDLFSMTSVHALRGGPGKRLLTPSQLRAVIITLTHAPRELVQQKVLEEVFDACDRERTGTVSLDRFIETLEAREKELLEQFKKIDKENTGHITVDALKAARDQGLIRLEELDMDELMTRMDSLSFSSTNPLRSNRKLQFSDFRNMVLALPPASSIRAGLERSRSTSSFNGDSSLEMNDLFHM